MTAVQTKPAAPAPSQSGDVSVTGAQPLPAQPATQARNPLHGLTLEAMVTALAAHYGWPGLAQRIPVRCFTSDPSVASSLKFLRKTLWARDKVEGLYLFMLREVRREARSEVRSDRSCDVRQDMAYDTAPPTARDLAQGKGRGKGAKGIHAG